MDQIRLKNHDQVFLFEAELRGQLHDGFGENATPTIMGKFHNKSCEE